MAYYITVVHRTYTKMSRLLMISCLVAVAAVAVTGTALPIAPAIIGTVDHPRYAYNYAVNDPLTGDNKAQWESRDGGNVKGSYSLVEPDGTLRVVDYHADDLTGFNAVVKKIGASVHPTPIHAPIKPLLVNPLINVPSIKSYSPINYGFGAAPLAIGLPKTILGDWSLPWDPLSGSYGGWVPLLSGPHATIISRKWRGGKLHKTVTGPIPLAGRRLVIRTTKGNKLSLL